MKCYYCEKECEGLVFEQSNLLVFAHEKCAVRHVEIYGNLTRVSSERVVRWIM